MRSIRPARGARAARRTGLRVGAAAVVVSGTVALAAPARADMAVVGKEFSVPEGASLTATYGNGVLPDIARFSDDAGGTAAPFSCPTSAYKATVQWGDGGPSSPGTVVFRFGGDFPFCEYAVTADYRYRRAGVYATSITVAGGPLAHSATAAGQITATPVAFSAEALPVTADPGRPFTGAIARFTTTNALVQASDLTVSINWDDGPIDTAGKITGGAGSFTVTGTHTYASPGFHIVRVALGEPAAAAGDAFIPGTVRGGTAPARLTAVPVTAAATVPFRGQVAAFFAGDERFQASDLRGATIDWGDGTGADSAVAVGGTQGSFTLSGAHTYATAGTYDIRVAVSAPGGPPTQSAARATVSAPAPPTFFIVASEVRAGTLRTRGLALRIAQGNADGRTAQLRVLDQAKRVVVRDTLRLGAASEVVWRPSAAQVRRLRPGRRYVLRILLSNGAGLQAALRVLV